MKRRPTVRDGELHIYWGREDRRESPDVIYHSGNGVPRCDRALLHCVMGSQRMAFDFKGRGYTFDPSLFDELKARGYDMTTLRFSIKKLPEAK